jgi:hypothetical protein
MWSWGLCFPVEEATFRKWFCSYFASVLSPSLCSCISWFFFPTDRSARCCFSFLISKVLDAENLRCWRGYGEVFLVYCIRGLSMRIHLTPRLLSKLWVGQKICIFCFRGVGISLADDGVVFAQHTALGQVANCKAS